MNHRSFMAIALMLIGGMGCSVMEEAFEEKAGQVIGQSDEQSVPFKLVFKAAPFTSGDVDSDTKTYVVPNGDYSDYEFKWSQKDTVGIYPDEGNQVYFVLKMSGGDASTAEFDGGAWTCKNGHEYRSYFPFYGDIYLDANKIPVTFTGQKQVGNENAEHFQKYDYMYTPAVTKGTDNLTFSYRHLVTAVFPWVELPGGHYTGITLSLDEPLFVTKGEYDLTAASPAIVGTSFSNTLHVDLDITFSTPDILKVYIPLAPLDMTGKTLTITVTDEDGQTYVFTKTPSKKYVAEKIYRLRSATSFVVYPEAVDLGLSVKWASFNLGATAPEEFGDYYAWGETKPYYISQEPLIWKEGKSAGYAWASYKWCNGSYNSLIKYNTKSSYGTVDNKTFLDTEDDAAHVALGESWRIPSHAEWEELLENCTITKTTVNGVRGRMVTSNKPGYTDKWIFLPAASSFSEKYLLDDTLNESSYYWSSSLDTSYPEGALIFYFGGHQMGFGTRSNGNSIRPVTD